MPRDSSSTLAGSSKRKGSSPWNGELRETPTIHALPQWRVNILERYYKKDPWPSDTVQEEVAKEVGISCSLAFQWFAARRAHSIGFPRGYYIVTLPNDCPRDRMSWRQSAAEFMEPELRAAEIERSQNKTTTNSLLMGHESCRPEMPPAEGRYQRGTHAPSERSLSITVGQFLQLQAGSTTLQEPLHYELAEFSPDYTILFDEPSVTEDAVQYNEELMSEYLILD